MKIQVFGPGCANCKKLHEQTLKAVEEFNKSLKVGYVTDIQEMVEMGIMSSPALVIDGKIVSAGSVPSVEKIKELLSGKS